MNWVGVIPFVYQPYLDECVKTMHPDFKKHVLFVDNTKDNLGIMKSHNLGVEKMREENADWLIVMSAAIRWGKPGGLDFIDQLVRRPGHHVIHGIGGTDDKDQQIPYGWHLAAFNRKTLEAIGLWDENFSPYSLDDIDMSLRIQKHFKDKIKWEKVSCDVSDTTHAHSINLGGVKATYAPRNGYFTRKWGRDGGEWDKRPYDRPFNDPEKQLSWWPAPDHALSIQNNELRDGEKPTS